ncbi:MAG: DUF1573 domain-containing protein [Phycisphaeraceae bacterium]|nr:DUF1573 domain-containing protein [Phycisphaeraceae bacterium]
MNIIRRSLLAATIAAISTMANGQLLDTADAPNRLPPQDERNAPRIVFERTQHDFGSILDEEKFEIEFSFVNEGPGVLRIDSAKGSCGCTVPSLAKSQFRAGERGSIKVVYDPKNRSGDQHQTVTVVTNDPQNKTMQLVVRANVLPSVIIEPKIAHFGQVRKDQPAEILVHVAGRTKDFRVIEATTDNPELFRVEIGKTEPFKFENEPEPLMRTELKVRMLPGAPMGFIRNNHVRLRTNDPKHEHVMLELIAQHLGDVEVLPERVSFGAVRIGDTFEQEVIVRSRTGTPFSILDVEDRNPDPNAVKVAVAPHTTNNGNKASAYVIRISGQIPENGRGVRGLLVIHTDVEREKTLNLPYFATVRRN